MASADEGRGSGFPTWRWTEEGDSHVNWVDQHDNIILHVTLRHTFGGHCVVLNTHTDGWGQEERLPLPQIGSVVTVDVDEVGWHIAYDETRYTYRHRLPWTSFVRVDFNGCSVSGPSSFSAMASAANGRCSVFPTWRWTEEGDSHVNWVDQHDNIIFHVTLRHTFGGHCVVLNTHIGGWGREERLPLPQIGSVVTVDVNEVGWHIAYDETRYTYRHRLPWTGFVRVDFNGCSLSGPSSFSEWTRPFLLQMSVEGEAPEWRLTFRTLGGNVAASLTWAAENELRDFPAVLLEAIERSGFEVPFRPLGPGNLRVVKPDGPQLDLSSTGASFLEQMGLTYSQ